MVQRLILVLAFSALISNTFATVTCHKTVDAELPGADFNINGLTRRCINSASCARTFGTINGKPGSFASCVAAENEAETCGVKTLNSYTTCCCRTNLCNTPTFQGETPETLAKANSQPVEEDIDELMNNALKR
uniref:Uncharacterized protein n=1 Tax=Panagrolaimus sp. PS1159 TaxID=55785 RepID=A0AC35FZL3_9BILA